jgi:cytidine deaminase
VKTPGGPVVVSLTGKNPVNVDIGDVNVDVDGLGVSGFDAGVIALDAEAEILEEVEEAHFGQRNHGEAFAVVNAHSKKNRQMILGVMAVGVEDVSFILH